MVWWWLTDKLSYGAEGPGVAGGIGMKIFGTKLQGKHIKKYTMITYKRPYIHTSIFSYLINVSQMVSALFKSIAEVS